MCKSGELPYTTTSLMKNKNTNSFFESSDIMSPDHKPPPCYFLTKSDRVTRLIDNRNMYPYPREVHVARGAPDVAISQKGIMRHNSNKRDIKPYYTETSDVKAAGSCLGGLQ